jgi:hypothetical protein
MRNYGRTDLVILLRSYVCDYNTDTEGIRGSQLRSFIIYREFYP